MRIALPVWEDKLSPVLDTASHFLVVEAVDAAEASRFETYLEEDDLSRRCLRLQSLAVELLICGAVSKPLAMMLKGAGIRVLPGLAGPAEAVLKAYLKGTLAEGEFFLPGFAKTDTQTGKPF